MRLTDGLALVGSGQARLSDRYDCNVYALEVPDGVVLVDTGSGRDTDRLVTNARAAFDGAELVAALLTHAHADHSQGGPDLQDAGVPVVAPTPSRRLLRAGTDHELGITAAKRDGVYPEDYRFEQYEPDRTVDPGSTVEVGGRTFEVVRSRGHAGDHVAYLSDHDGRRDCFVGDTVYPDGSISLLNTPTSSLADYRADIDNLVGRDVDALLPGHGLPRVAEGQAAIDTAADALAGMYSPPSRT